LHLEQELLDSRVKTWVSIVGESGIRTHHRRAASNYLAGVSPGAICQLRWVTLAI
jgi:hypothetical protein